MGSRRAGGRFGRCLIVLGSLALVQPAEANVPDIRLFFEAASTSEEASKAGFAGIAGAGWRDNYAALIVDLARFLPRRRVAGGGADEDSRETIPGDGTAPGVPRGFVTAPEATAATPPMRARERLIAFLEAQTGQRFGQDLRRWRKWIWSLPDEPHPQYARFKAELYARIDPKMASFFQTGVRHTIRLDEIDWGGVGVNGIPPLDHPLHVTAAEAGYLDPKDVVFGIQLKGEARAYPKRILAWHELARDRVGGVELAVVYCTLCGTVIPYGAEVAGKTLTFGTSGLLYRSNKLMFDAETGHLWNAVDGRPVVGPLAGEPIEMTAYPVVTTTWREWVATHPDTTVLSNRTGFDRDYSEGAAYRDYFARDDLMFEVPKVDPRLKKKAEVLGLLLRPAGDPEGPRGALALSTAFLKKHPLHRESFAGRDLVVVTTPDGANRVYEAGGVDFTAVTAEGVRDGAGRVWTIQEDALALVGSPETRRLRVPARRSFWFGWFAQYTDTRLVR